MKSILAKCYTLFIILSLLAAIKGVEIGFQENNPEEITNMQISEGEYPYWELADSVIGKANRESADWESIAITGR